MQGQIKKSSIKLQKPCVPILYPFDSVFFLPQFILLLQSDSHTQLWNFTLPLEKASIDLAGIRVQDDPTVVLCASPVDDRGAFNLVSAGCVLYASSCLQAKAKAVGSPVPCSFIIQI